jgi:hypothetical protein
MIQDYHIGAQSIATGSTKTFERTSALKSTIHITVSTQQITPTPLVAHQAILRLQGYFNCRGPRPSSLVSMRARTRADESLKPPAWGHASLQFATILFLIKFGFCDQKSKVNKSKVSTSQRVPDPLQLCLYRSPPDCG